REGTAWSSPEDGSNGGCARFGVEPGARLQGPPFTGPRPEERQGALQPGQCPVWQGGGGGGYRPLPEREKGKRKGDRKGTSASTPPPRSAPTTTAASYPTSCASCWERIEARRRGAHHPTLRRSTRFPLIRLG